MHGEETLGIPSNFAYRSLKRHRKCLDKEVKSIEAKFLSLLKEDQQQKLTLLTSVPGIGQKTALFLIVVTNGFSKFETASQLCSYVGITPTTRELGSSVRGRPRISKVVIKSCVICGFYVRLMPVSTTKRVGKFMSTL